jgi:heat shock protein HtpX
MIFRMFFQASFYGGFSGRRSRGDGERKGGAMLAIVIAIALVVVAWILAIVIRFALSRRREFLADAGAVELTKNPDAMITALRKIENRGELARANSAVMEMCIDNPRTDFSDLFATHPSIEARCDALVKFAGGHDPGPLALDAPEPQRQIESGGPWGDAPPQPGAGGPWGPEPDQGGKPFLPDRPPLGGDEGPWGPKR